METISTSDGTTYEQPQRIDPDTERGHHGVPHTDMRGTGSHPLFTTVVGEAGAGTPDSARRVIHHWAQGPLDLRARRKRVRLRDGSTAAARYELRWFFDRAEGTTRRTALQAIYDVILNRVGWIRAGVHFVRTARFDQADLIVRVIPSDSTHCGAGAAGCYSWGYEDHGKPVLELGAEYVGSLEFANLVNHELGHATFRMHDMYPIPGVAGHDDYDGVMGTWEAARRSGYYPPAHEVQWATEWLAGRAANVHQH
jgi:hypothetical protein